MTNTTQTDLPDQDALRALLEELLGEYWDTAFRENVHGESCGDEANATLCQIRETVEALLIANRKQVLLEAAFIADRITARTGLQSADCYRTAYAIGDELRRMALETTGVDKGEKE
jgi:hypothetical protein